MSINPNNFFINIIIVLTIFIFISVIRPGLISAVLQSAAQYFWFTIKGKRFDEYMEHDMDGWHLPFSPFW